jgi:hypothetical protein
MGDARSPFALSLEERNSVGVGTFHPSFGFKDFHHAARLHPLAGGTRDGDHQPLDGERQTGLRSRSRPQLQGCSSSLLRRRARRARALPPAQVGWPPPLPASGGGNHPPALRRRRPPAMPGKVNCCCPARMQHSALFLAFVARAGARTCRCASERPALWLSCLVRVP